MSGRPGLELYLSDLLDIQKDDRKYPIKEFNDYLLCVLLLPCSEFA
jgi:hypothetical protein